jgi:hypothetical protein
MNDCGAESANFSSLRRAATLLDMGR